MACAGVGVRGRGPFRARLGVGRGDPGRCPGLPWCAPLGRSAGAELSALVARQRRVMAIVRGDGARHLLDRRVETRILSFVLSESGFRTL